MRDRMRGYLMTALGTFILSLGAVIFIFQAELITGGMTGLAVLFDLIIPLDFFTSDRIVFVLSIIFLLIAFLTLGRDFVYKTLLSSLLYPFFISLLLPIVREDFLGGFFVMPNDGLGLLLSALFGGLFVGVGCAITFVAGGSTGGTDIIALVLCRYIKRLRQSSAIFLVDGLIIIIGAFITRDLSSTLLGVLVAIVTSLVIDKFLIGQDGAVSCEIVTECARSICEGIISELSRTATVFDCVGAYRGERKQLILVCISMREYSTLLRIIAASDPHAFVTVSRAHEIRGLGWGEEKMKNEK